MKVNTIRHCYLNSFSNRFLNQGMQALRRRFYFRILDKRNLVLKPRSEKQVLLKPLTVLMHINTNYPIAATLATMTRTVIVLSLVVYVVMSILPAQALFTAPHKNRNTPIELAGFISVLPCHESATGWSNITATAQVHLHSAVGDCWGCDSLSCKIACSITLSSATIPVHDFSLLFRGQINSSHYSALEPDHFASLIYHPPYQLSLKISHKLACT